MMARETQTGARSVDRRDRWAVARAALIGLAIASGARGGEVEAPDRGVMQLLKSRCVKCHGPAVRKGGLNLATPRGLARGGDGGPAVARGKPEESPIWEAVEEGKMPPTGPLDESEKGLLRRWIEAGAPGLPDPSPGSAEGGDHWAFAPPSRPEPPEVRDDSRIRNPVDRFLQAALEARGLAIGPEADRATLVRRVALDLTGLPPTPEEIARFEQDSDPEAYERLIDGYLASPRYAERWGKFWLDAVGFADSNGYFDADSDRPLAYRYRDYVLRSWAEDRPLDRFIREQIAGDELAGFRPGGPVDEAAAQGLIATHFLRNAPDGTGESDGNAEELRADRYAVLEGTSQVIGSALLGLTVQCARCHDHKFEPITQKDYYALYAVIAPAYNVADWVKPNARVVDGPARPGEMEAWEARSREIDTEVAGLGISAVFEDPFRSLAEERRASLDAAIGAAEARRGLRPGRISYIAEPAGPPPEVRLLKRGQYGDPGPVVEPAPPSVLADPENPFDPRALPGGTSGRRLALAGWLTRPGSRPAALLARVLANRVWQGHFGVGLVATPDNLGYSGSPPSNPELLEYLASELARGGWSARSLHRLILGSAAYRQSGAADVASIRADPDDVLLWRYPLRRLDAESIRDGMLAVSGELDETAGGPSVAVSTTEEGEVVVAEEAEGARRRSVFLQQRRTRVVGLLGVFDSPSIVATCARRETSTIPLQSLSLLNSGFVVARGRAFADRLRREAGVDLGRRIDRGFLLAWGRSPSPEERAAAERFLAEQPGRYPGAADAEERAWADFCQMLLSSNAFLYWG